MALVSLREVSVAFGAAPLLDGVTLHVEQGERICLLGRNGAGKSTLLRVLAGEIVPDAGVVERRQGLRLSMLVQQVPRGGDARVRDIVRDGLEATEAGSDPGRRRVEATLSRMDLDGDALFAPLSAGNKRRVLLARALACDPDVLLLDEPTNHLDIPAIAWLEDRLRREERTLVVVSHDRAFLRAIATRVVELDRGALHGFVGGYDAFVERRQAALEAEHEQARQLDKKLAEEEAWIRRGVKARAVRDMGRVRALERLRAQRAARRERLGTAKMSIQEAERSGKLVVEAEGMTAGYDGHEVVRGFSTIVLRGDRVGIIGPNGCGKTTLLRALLGELEPLGGRVRVGARVQVAYFDQLRAQLDDAATVAESLTEGGDWVEQEGRRRHVIGYLEDFLFPPERAKSPVSALSGGERNRLLLAKLFLQPSNLMVLDEPTNDLDLETLELLESLLIDYRGTVLLVSHDRAFVDNVVTSTIAYVSEGRFVEHAGGYSDWLAAERAADLGGAGEPERGAPEEPAAKRKKPKTARPRKRTFKENAELDELPARIEALEAEQAALHEEMGDPSFYQRDKAAIAAATDRIQAIETELERAYARWEELEAIGG